MRYHISNKIHRIRVRLLIFRLYISFTVQKQIRNEFREMHAVNMVGFRKGRSSDGPLENPEKRTYITRFIGADDENNNNKKKIRKYIENECRPGKNNNTF